MRFTTVIAALAVTAAAAPLDPSALEQTAASLGMLRLLNFDDNSHISCLV
jgi:hypothetical protein